jgi:hypothetical protein
MIRFLAVALLAFLFVEKPQAATGGKGNGAPSAAAAMQSKQAGSGHSGGGRRFYDPRAVPPLDTDRKVSEQDCSKPLDLSAGNLRCK